MKTVLIITYYWPPAGGPGVQRILKFAKYLPQFGWKPVILTVQNGEYPAVDESLLNDIPNGCAVYKTKSWEPNIFYKKFVGAKKEDRIPVAILTEKNPNWKKRIANWVRLNLFIPDAKIGWKPFAVNKGKQIINELKPEIIFSSSPPPTVHLIAKSLAHYSKIKWVADFRDPWTNIYHYTGLNKNIISKQMDLFLEKNILENADNVTVVNPGFFNQTKHQNHITISNGYDDTDFQFSEKTVKNDKFTIRYMGSMKTKQYVKTFFQILHDLAKDEKIAARIRLEFIGNIYPEVMQNIEILCKNFEVNFKGYMKHNLALQIVSGSDLLFFIIGKSHINHHLLTGKVFEYLMIKKPIIAFGPPEGAADLLLRETKSGKLFDYEDYNGARDYLWNQYQNWEINKTYDKFDVSKINPFSREALTEKLVNVFEDNS